MTREELAQLLDALGAPGPAWTDAQRTALDALLARDPQAAEQVRAAQRLEEQFSALQAAPTAPSDALRDRILRAALAGQHGQKTDADADAGGDLSALDRFDAWWTGWSGSLWRPALAACVPLMFGLSIGLLDAQAEQEDHTAQYASLYYTPLDSQLETDWLADDDNE